jgi:hypothetical protein
MSYIKTKFDCKVIFFSHFLYFFNEVFGRAAARAQMRPLASGYSRFASLIPAPAARAWYGAARRRCYPSRKIKSVAEFWDWGEICCMFVCACTTNKTMSFIKLRSKTQF